MIFQQGICYKITRSFGAPFVSLERWIFVEATRKAHENYPSTFFDIDVYEYDFEEDQWVGRTILLIPDYKIEEAEEINALLRT